MVLRPIVMVRLIRDYFNCLMPDNLMVKNVYIKKLQGPVVRSPFSLNGG